MNNISDKVVKDPKDKMTSLTPAVLGIPSVSHGAKLAPNMNMQEKSQLLMRLEEFREKRRCKLVASVLAKGKLSSISKPSNTLPRPKLKTKLNPASGTETNQSNIDGMKTVFERLYENAGKKTAKPSDENKQGKFNNMKKPQNVKLISCKSQDKGCKVPKIVVVAETSKPVIDSDPSVEKVTLGDSGVGDVTKPSSVDSQSLESKPQVVGIVNEDMTVEQQAPLLGTSRNDTQGQNNEERGNIITSDNVGIFEEKEESKENYQELKVGNFYDSVKDLGLNKAKIFKNDRKPNTEMIRKAPLRRSISLIFRKKMGNYESAIHRTRSEHNLQELIKDKKQEDITKENTKEGFNLRYNRNETGANSVKGTKTVCFLTPKNNTLNAFHLRNKLENWLSENGHSIETYKHLRCFGLAVEETKWTPYHRQQKVDESCNTSFYSTAPNTPISEIIDESDKENITPPPPYPKVERVDLKDVEGWLSDLYKLIVHVKYPGDRCEEWLNAISKKFPGCAQLPIYWECVAAINGNPGGVSLEEGENISNKNEEVEGSLAELLDKMVLDEKCKSTSKTERGLSVKNIFNSKTVQFALKEKPIKELDPVLRKKGQQKVLVATPVRRSARLQTPNKTDVIKSLNSLDPKLRRSISFKPNEALFAG